MIDYEKFASYSKAGPRYTSYPTAPEFHSDFGEDAYVKEMIRSNELDREISLYVHLPFCRSACYFCGCNVVYTSKEDTKERYIGYLEKELDLLSKTLDMRRKVRQIHFGGGTPTFYSVSQLGQIIDLIRKYFRNIVDDVEFGCEVDPRFFTDEQMRVLKSGGVNRISFGVQDFDERVQEAIHRLQPYDLTKKAVEVARDHQIQSINIDLIYGLPYQSVESFLRTLELTLSLDPDRMALFNYAHLPWMKKSMRKIDETTIPTPDVKLKIMKEAIERFGEAGYEMIGMDHFAKPDDELFVSLKNGRLHRNFQGYTTHGGTEMIGIGVTSIGEGDEYYVQNFRDLDLYEKAIDEGRLPIMRGFKLSRDDMIRKRVIMQLMSNFTLDFATIDSEFDIVFEQYFANELKELKAYEDDDLIVIKDRHIAVGATGRLLIRNIVMPFDAYLQKIPVSKRRFSKTV